MVMADGPGKEGEPNRAQGDSVPTSQDSAESKRLEARRRFLLGGAAAFPVILHVTAARAQSRFNSKSFCMSRFGNPGNPQMGMSETTFVCTGQETDMEN